MFSTFGTVGPVDIFFKQIGPTSVVYFDKQKSALHALLWSTSPFYAFHQLFPSQWKKKNMQQKVDLPAFRCNFQMLVDIQALVDNWGKYVKTPKKKIMTSKQSRKHPFSG